MSKLWSITLNFGFNLFIYVPKWHEVLLGTENVTLVHENTDERAIFSVLLNLVMKSGRERKEITLCARRRERRTTRTNWTILANCVLASLSVSPWTSPLLLPTSFSLLLSVSYCRMEMGIIPSRKWWLAAVAISPTELEIQNPEDWINRWRRREQPLRRRAMERKERNTRRWQSKCGSRGSTSLHFSC